MLIVDPADCSHKRGDTVVALVVPSGAHDVGQAALATLMSLVASTESSTPVLVVGPTATVEAIADRFDAGEDGQRVVGVALPHATPEVVSVNAAIRASGAADVAIVRPGRELCDGWLEKLRDAALSDATVASATPLFRSPRHARADPCHPADLSLRPRIATMGPDCVYVRRAALDILGTLDEALPLPRALDAAALQLVSHNLIHLGVADVMLHSGGASEDVTVTMVPQAVNDVQRTIADDGHGVLRRALRAASLGQGISVTVDAHSLTSAAGGTQTYVLQLITALASDQRIKLRVVVPPDLLTRAEGTFAGMPEIEFLSYDAVADGSQPRSDVVHRPQQVFSPDDLALLHRLGERVVITHQDLIAYHNIAYHPNHEAWRQYRRVTRLALGAADQVVFFSQHAKRDALGEDLVSPDRAHVVGIGVDAVDMSQELATAPADVDPSSPFLLCLGADYMHKNRPFAMRLLVALHNRGWRGQLVLAGAHVPFGSSHAAEQAFRAAHPDLAGDLIDLGEVDAATRHWLFAHASAVLYPTTYEGFGLIPMEAASWQVPCLFAAQASLAELCGDAATLVPWDADASADSVLPVLAEGPARTAHLHLLTGNSRPDWREIADQVYGVYRRAVVAPASPAAPHAQQALEREGYIARLERELAHDRAVAQQYQAAYHDLTERVSCGLPLIDRGGLLTPAQQRGLMRIASRKYFKGLLLAPLGVVGHRSTGANDS